MDTNSIRVLYIDDESGNLTSFKAGFRRRYQVFVAQSADEAMKILEVEHDIHVIIADQRMPNVTGVDFFEKIDSVYPKSIRILITGYSDINTVIESINRGKVFRYLSKPWKEPELQVSIENAYELYCTRQNLELKNVELEKTNSELNRFVYSASHDLRAPLMSVLGLVQVAKLDEIDDKSTQYLDMIERSIFKLDRFVLNIIDYYQNSRGIEKYVAIDFKSLMDEVVENLQYYLKNDIDFQVTIDQQTAFYSDEFRVRIVFNNLISNAIKFQRKEETNKYVKVHVKVSDAMATIVVEDNGMGISPEYQQDIFKMFFRATPDGDGSGIGLFIVNEALTKIGGDISLQSVLHKGTIFTLQIPNKLVL